MWSQLQPNGKYKFNERYVDPITGRAKTVSVTYPKDNAATRKKAAAALAEKIKAKLSAAGTEEEMTLHALIEKYNAYQYATFRESTAQQNEYMLIPLERALGGDSLINRITAGYVVDSLTATGKSATWKNEKIKHFKSLFRWAYQNDYLKSLACVDKLKPFPDMTAREKIQDKYMEPSELHTLLDGMNNERWALLTRFLVLSGLRIGEAIALQNRDVDFHARQIHVNKTFSLNCGSVNDPKTVSSKRDVSMQPELYEVCKRIKQMHRADIQIRKMNDELFFPGEGGGFINYPSYSKYFRENTERILHRRLSVHALRHTHTSLLAAQGVPFDVISRRLGHENSDITKTIYFHVTKQLQEMDAAAVAKVQILA